MEGQNLRRALSHKPDSPKSEENESLYLTPAPKRKLMHQKIIKGPTSDSENPYEDRRDMKIKYNKKLEELTRT